MKKIDIAILGCGTVGGGTYRVIEEEGAYIAHKENIELNVKKVLALDYAVDIPREKRAASIEEICADPDITIVAELMGGVEPAKSFIIQCLRAGKSVVSANKQLIAQYWAEIEQEAKKTGAGFYFEASVGGGIPILRAVNESMQANTINSVYGIVNGTTNYILSKMSDEGGDFEDVLREAQALGYAEADPTADVDAYDAMYKLSILASMAFHVRLPIEHIFREGIRKVSAEDIACAKELGMVVKLLAIGKRKGELVQVRVHPTLIPADSMLAGVKGSFNAIMLNGSAVGDVMFYGRGAGDLPTASAVVSDIVVAAKTAEHKYATFMNRPAMISPTLCFDDNWESGFYIRLRAEDRPGTLAKITKVFGDNGVSLGNVIQRDAEGGVATILFVTHNSKELSVKAAIEQLEALEEVKEVANIMRVEHV